MNSKHLALITIKQPRLISAQTSCDCLCHSISVLPVCPRMSHFVQDLEKLLKVTRLAFVCLERGIYCFIYLFFTAYSTEKKISPQVHI